MRYLIRLIELVVLLLLIAITVKNSHVVDFKFMMGYEWQAPLIVFLLLFFIIGALVGLTATFGYYFRMRRVVYRLKKELRKKSQAVALANDSSEKIVD